MKLDQNKLAAEICRRLKSNLGKGRLDLSIAQVKAVLNTERTVVQEAGYAASEVLKTYSL